MFIKKKKQEKQKSINTSWFMIKLEWCELDFTSKIVLFIGLTLFVELLIAIFIGGRHDWANMSFRTSLSAILGYLLGGMGKGQKSTRSQEESLAEPPLIETSQPLPGPKTADVVPGKCQHNHRFISEANHVRTLIAGMVCVAGIMTLFFSTVFDLPVYGEGVLQLRDMISTTLGFLVSTSIKKE